MWMLHRFLSRYSKDKLLSLILFYPTFYLTYYSSAIREGIVISIFIGFLLECLIKKRWVKYYLVSLVALFLHSVALLFFILPLIYLFNLKNLSIIFVLSMLMGMAILVIMKGNSLSVFSLSERLVMGGLVLYLYYDNKKAQKGRLVTNEDRLLTFFVKIYVFSICIYILLMYSALYSSRCSAVFRCIEVCLFTMLLSKNSKKGWIALLIIYSAFMVCKNLAAYIDQGDYYEFVKFYNFPYFTIFDINSIWKYRIKSVYFR
jgi:hypothetical protein